MLRNNAQNFQIKITFKEPIPLSSDEKNWNKVYKTVLNKIFQIVNISLST